jgi:hypothetical protein
MLYLNIILNRTQLRLWEAFMENNKNILIDNSEREIRIVYKNSAFANVKNVETAVNVNTKVILSKEHIQEAKKEGKSITVVVEDEERCDLYTWRFRGKDIQNAEFEAEELDLSLSIVDGNEFEAIRATYGKEEDNSGIIIRMNTEKKLPFQGNLSIYTGNQNGLKTSKNVYVYTANNSKGKLDSIVGGHGYKMDEDGYLSIAILLFADYAILPGKPEEEIIRSLRNQITVKKEIELEAGMKKTIKVKFPKYLAKVEQIEDKTGSKAIGGITISYSSENKEIATVNSVTGRVKAVEAGETIIRSKVTLYSGKTKELKTKIIVK